jgi:alanyl-tRNA synthetase
LHWALHEIVSHDAVQKGSYVGPEKLTFDFSSAALTKSQVQEVEKLVNEKIAEDAAGFLDRDSLRCRQGTHRHHAVLWRQVW